MPRENGRTITLEEKSHHIDGGEVSRYEFETNRWERMATARDIVIKGAVTLNNHIFVVGVHELDEVMMCQAYDEEKNTWISLPAPTIFRVKFSVVANQEQVFGVPKYWEEVHPEKVEVYDPLENTRMSLPDLPFEYRSPKAVVVDDKIIVYENNEEQSRSSRTWIPLFIGTKVLDFGESSMNHHPGITSSSTRFLLWTIADLLRISPLKTDAQGLSGNGSFFFRLQ
ncbi:hypothetical protein AVEN_167700-1 [Araneus ventricosus]|uniref:Uncharacterized protein n=1 Tax=Araneus ventricosus TaxID=182803 RepID=A0A4Y2MIA5_ARAVE|nr:hypothetical protein AVEN_167700-1 [Araneus ventricosus]